MPIVDIQYILSTFLLCIIGAFVFASSFIVWYVMKKVVGINSEQ